MCVNFQKICVFKFYHSFSKLFVIALKKKNCFGFFFTRFLIVKWSFSNKRFIAIRSTAERRQHNGFFKSMHRFICLFFRCFNEGRSFIVLSFMNMFKKTCFAYCQHLLRKYQLFNSNSYSFENWYRLGTFFLL